MLTLGLQREDLKGVLVRNPPRPLLRGSTRSKGSCWHCGMEMMQQPSGHGEIMAPGGWHLQTNYGSDRLIASHWNEELGA